MPKVALVKNLRLGLENVGFDDLSDERIRDRVNVGGVVFREVESTMDVYGFINESLVRGESNMVEVVNCLYTEDMLVQGFSVDTMGVNDCVFVKRKLMRNDTYTYVGFEPENDVYEYMDFGWEDIVRVVRGKYCSRGVVVGVNGLVSDMRYLNGLGCTDVCDFVYEDGVGVRHEFKYVNLQRMVGCSENDGTDPEGRGNVVEERVAALLDGGGIHHVYSQMETPFGLLNCFYLTVGTEKNEIMSNLLGTDVYGNVLVGLENNRDNNDMIIDLDAALFRRMVAALEVSRRELKNRNFFNVYYELSDRV